MQLNDDASAASFEKPDDTFSDTDDILTRPTTPSFNALQERLHELSANRDEVKIAAQQEVVNRLQVLYRSPGGWCFCVFRSASILGVRCQTQLIDALCILYRLKTLFHCSHCNGNAVVTHIDGGDYAEHPH